jgi:predicted nucleic acid binding AN1-type Zn finger protein
MSKGCGFASCREPLSLIATPCSLCRLTFCMAHRLPEVHSNICKEIIKKEAKAKYTTETARMRTLLNKSQKSAVTTADVAKEQINVKNRLKEAIDKKKAARSKK